MTEGDATEEQPRRMSRPDFTRSGPDTITGKYLRRFWQPVLTSNSIGNGCAKTVTIMNEDFLVFRGHGGRVQVMEPRCAHRGMLLSPGLVEDDCIRCFYHGWKYDQSGQCVEQPAEKDGIGFSVQVKLRSYPTEEYLGLVFAYLGDGPPPALPKFDVFEAGGVVDARASFREVNYYNQLEISVDETHFNFVHGKSSFTEAGLNKEFPIITGEETEYGIARRGQRGNKVRISHIIMPNLLYGVVPNAVLGWSELLAWRVPVNDESHISFLVYHTADTGEAAEATRQRRHAQVEETRQRPSANELARKVLHGEILIDELLDHPEIIVIQDLVAMMGQSPQRDLHRDRLGRSDHQVALLRRILGRELRALERGRDTKQWHWRSDTEVTTGL